MAQRCGDCLNNELGEIARPVKMPATRDRTKRPHEALLQLDIGIFFHMFRIGGSRKAPVRYHPYVIVYLILDLESGLGDSVWWVV